MFFSLFIIEIIINFSKNVQETSVKHDRDLFIESEMAFKILAKQVSLFIWSLAKFSDMFWKSLLSFIF